MSDMDCKNKLEELCSAKKKSYSKTRADTFCNCWKEYYAKHGYDETAEEYLFNGVTYLCEKPLKDILWEKLKESADSAKSFFDKIRQGKRFNNCEPPRAHILMGLLAYCLNDLDRVGAFVKEIIYVIPRSLVNKEGKLKAVDFLEKHFLEILDDSVVNKADISLEYTRDFDMIYKALEAFGQSKPDLSGETKTKLEWALALFKKKSAVPEKKDDCAEVSKKTPVEVSEQDEEIQKLKNSLQKADEKIAELKKEVQEHEKSSAEYAELVGKRTAELNQKCAAKENECENLKLRIRDLNDSLKKLNETIALKDAEIQSKDAEIKGKNDSIALLKITRNNEFQEAMNSLSNRIKPFYDQYKGCEHTPMNADLGEGMRDFLKTIFRIMIQEANLDLEED